MKMLFVFVVAMILSMNGCSPCNGCDKPKTIQGTVIGVDKYGDPTIQLCNGSFVRSYYIDEYIVKPCEGN